MSGHYTSAADSLITGFCFGFPILFQGPSSSTAAPNLLSAKRHPDVVDRYLTKEVLAQRLAGPFTQPPFQNCPVSPIGVVPNNHLVNFVAYSVYQETMIIYCRSWCLAFITPIQCVISVSHSQTIRPWSMLLITTVVGLSFYCRSCKDWCLCAYKITYYPVPGIKNDLANSLSRLQIQRFRRLAPAYMQLSPLPIPTVLQPEQWQMW